MFKIRKYGKYLVLGCLAMTVVFTPNLVGAVVSYSAQMNVQIAQASFATNHAANEAEIKKVLLADAQKQNWQPEIGLITIADDYAIATVSDENTGGESVLKKQQGVWKIIGGTGGAFSQPEELVQYGKVPLPNARRLLKIRASQQQH